VGSLLCRFEDIGLAVGPVGAVQLEPDPLVEGHQRAGGDPELGLVRLDHLERRQPVPSLVLDQGAVRAVELSGQGSQGHVPVLPSATESDSQASFRPKFGGVRHQSIGHV
jgi:hypothetical protein